MPSQDRFLKLSEEVSQWFDEFIALTTQARATRPENDAEELAWAEKWVSDIVDVYEKLDKLVNRLDTAEALELINAEQNESLKDILMLAARAGMEMTDHMCVTRDHLLQEKINRMKEDGQKRMAVLLVKKERLQRRRDELESQLSDMKDKKIEREQILVMEQTLAMRFEEKNEAEEAKRMMMQGYCEELKNIEFDQDETLVEMSKRRRSRSLSKRIVRTVKKTMRRSISVVNKFFDPVHNSAKLIN